LVHGSAHDSSGEFERNEETLSFTRVDSGFGERRYSFDAPDFGSVRDDETVSRAAAHISSCQTCDSSESEPYCVIAIASEIVMEAPIDASGREEVRLGRRADGAAPNTMAGENDQRHGQ
jgi:hypothetical protein